MKRSCSRRHALLLLPAALLGASPPLPAATAAQPSYAQRTDAMDFAEAIAEKHALDPASVRRGIAQARFQPAVARLIMPAAVPTAKNWAAYRDRVLEPARIEAGAAFWRRNAAWLYVAEERYGVPPEIVAGIVGVETLYGRQMGGFRALDALATLAFDFPAGRSDRSAFFRGELGALFALASREGFDVASLKGSYAGALGMAQFMPSSWLRFAIDFDGDGRIDLHGSNADVIGSVANYLYEFGWQRGRPTHFEVLPPADPADLAILREPDIAPAWNADYFADRGARLLDDGGRQYDRALALVELPNGEFAPPSYVAGTFNFWAITRYNWSAIYAMAVIELGTAVARAAGASR